LALLASLRAELSRAADPAKAPAMQAYMKSTMPYWGVQLPELRRICRRVFAGFEVVDEAAWRRAVLTLWRRAQRREERYAALTLTGDRRADDFQTLAALPMYEEMIVTGAWWDLVDDIAVHRIGPLLRRYPRPMARILRQWSRDADMWKRRSAILSQISFKADTDLELLYDCIERSLGSKEFFLQKAIGWALRQYAWTDPQEVVRYVQARGEALRPLSRREALKNVGKGNSSRPRQARARPRA
jgi:3-methyladenine DNA glycosylase AlkD